MTYRGDRIWRRREVFLRVVRSPREQRVDEDVDYVEFDVFEVATRITLCEHSVSTL